MTEITAQNSERDDDTPVSHVRSEQAAHASAAALPRRDFLKLAWGAMATLAAGGMGFVGLRFLASRVGGGNFGSVITAGLPEEFPVGTVTAFNDGRFYLVRLPDAAFLALYWKCTHLDCVVLWDEEAGRFDCPCHGSQFEPTGAVLNAPAPKPLARFPVMIEDGKIKVDTGSLIPRDAISAEDLVYLPQDLPQDQRWGQAQEEEEWYEGEE